MFSWFKNGELLVEGDSNVTNYILSRAKMSDAGNYTCIVKNDFGIIQHNFNVEVYSEYNLKNKIKYTYLFIFLN